MFKKAANATGTHLMTMIFVISEISLLINYK